jgi:hypothetical protein
VSLLRTTVLLGVTALVTMGATSCQWVTIVDPASGTTFTTAQTVTIAANTGVSPEVATVTRVEFRDNGTLRCTDSTAPYQCNWSVSSSVNGDHSWVAKALLSNGDFLQSEPTALKVAIGGTPSGDPELVGFVPGIGTALDVAVDGGEAFVASEQFRMSVADINASSSTYLDVLGSSEQPGVGKSAAVRGNRAVVLGEAPNGTTQITVLDVTYADAPRVLGEASTSAVASNAWKVALNSTGSVAVAAMGTLGIWVIDLANPAAPRVAGSFDTPGLASDVALNSTGNVAYVADGTGDLQIVSLSTPSQPTRLGSLSLVGSMRSVDVQGTTAYLLSQTGGLQVVDVATPSAPRQIGTAGTGTGYDLSVDGTRAALVTGSNGQNLLEVFDIANPASPRSLGSIGLGPIGAAWAVDVAGGRAYVAADAGGIAVYDVTGAPKASGAVATVGATAAVAIDGLRALVADFPGTLSVLDL